MQKHKWDIKRFLTQYEIVVDFLLFHDKELSFLRNKVVVIFLSFHDKKLTHKPDIKSYLRHEIVVTFLSFS